MSISTKTNIRSHAPGLQRLNQPPKGEFNPSISPKESYEPEDPGRNWGKIALVGLGAAVAIGGLTGCSSPSTPPPVSQCTSTDFTASTSDGEFRVEVVPQDLGTVDLVRNTTTETDSEGDTETVDVPLSDVGIYLGDGIFFDSNGNLSLIPARAFGVQVTPSDATTIQYQPQGWGNDLTIRRDGRGTASVDGEWFGSLNQFEVRESENGAYLDLPSIGTFGDINFSRSGNTTTIDPIGFGNWDQIKIVRNGDKIKIEQPGWGNDIVITKTENSMSVDMPGWGGNVTAHYCDNEIKIDRVGSWSDNRLKMDGERLEIDNRGWGADASIRFEDGRVEVKTDAWGGDATIRYR